MVGVEDQNRILQPSVGLQLLHQHADEHIRLHRVGHGVAVVLLGPLGDGIGSGLMLLADEIVGAVGTVTGDGDDEGEEGAVLILFL